MRGWIFIIQKAYSILSSIVGYYYLYSIALSIQIKTIYYVNENSINSWTLVFA